MSQSRYEAYKDSGVAWLGQVPAHWNLFPMYSLFSVRDEPNKGLLELNLLSLSYGNIVNKDIDSLDGLLPASFETYQVVYPGDIVFRFTDLQNDKRSLRSALVRQKGIITSAYLAVKPISGNTHYYNHLFRAYDGLKVFYSMGGGLRQSMNYQDVKRLPIILPPLAEQQAIAAFLDRECARIDALVAAQQRMITLSKEKRQALIAHVVTQGLDPAAPRKDSGVAWLGQVPAHWEVKKIKDVVSQPITDGPHETPEFQDDGVVFISAEAVSSGKIDFEKKRGFISHSVNEHYSLKYKPQLLDIYMIKSGATTGVTAICEDRIDFNIWSPLAAIRCNSLMNPYYLLNFMRSINFQDAIKLFWTFGTQQNIGMGTLSALHVLVPPLAEQQAIAAFLDRECARIDVLISKAEQSIVLLRERRSALIAAAVTGQIRVDGVE